MPVGALACKFADKPEQTDTFAAAGACGGGVTFAVTGVGALVQPLAVTTT